MDYDKDFYNKHMTLDEKVTISPDKPETDPNLDSFGYAPFARNLADSLVRMAPEDGFVIAIYAPWGAGKSTMLNFVEHYLTQIAEEDSPVVIRFNPWWFTGHESLTRHFFEQLAASLTSKVKALAKGVGKKLGHLGNAVSANPIAKQSRTIEGAASILSLFAGKPKDVTELKRQLSKQLNDQGKTIVVFVDDIDRLDKEEILQLFKTIKAVADFPRTIYVLAFDKAPVIEALGGSPLGANYLEKMVQVPFELPIPERGALVKLFTTRLNLIIGDMADGSFDKNEWVGLYTESLAHFFDTPRAVIRLVNTLAVSLPPVVNEVNLVDFVGVEALRVFAPTAYDTIRRNPGRFATVPLSERIQNSSDVSKFHQTWMSEIQEADLPAVKKLIARLFPFVATLLSEQSYGSGSASQARKDRRLSSIDAFHAYFSLAVPPGAITRAEIKSILSTTKQPKRFADALLEFSKSSSQSEVPRIRALLDRLQDYTAEDIPSEHIPGVIFSLFDIADRVAEFDPASGFLDMDSSLLLGRLFFQLIRRLDDQDRYDTLHSAFEKSSAIGFIIRQTIVLGQQHGKHTSREPDPDRWLVTLPELNELEAIAARRVREASAEDGFLSKRGLPTLLHVWRLFGNESDVLDWVSKSIEPDGGLAEFLVHFTRHTRTTGVGMTGEVITPYMNLTDISEFADVEAISERVSRIDVIGLSVDQGEAVRLFIRARSGEFDDIVNRW